jgi:ubiquitin-conjugating enzyme E2 C
VKVFCKGKGDGVSAFPDASKGILFWKAKITGAANTPYANQTYELQMEFPEDYPMRPPTVMFVTPCFHPNVHEGNNKQFDLTSSFI